MPCPPASRSSLAGRISGGIDLVLSFLYWKRIRRSLIDLPRVGCFNFHPGPLPEFRGRRGYNFAILDAVPEYGASCHWVAEEIDEGDLVEVRRFPVGAHETALSLESRTMRVLVEMFDDFIARVTAGIEVPRRPQGAGRSVSRGQMLAAMRADLTEAPDELERKIRAFWYPPHHGAYVEVGGRKYTLVDEETLSRLGRFLHGSRSKPVPAFHIFPRLPEVPTHRGHQYMTKELVKTIVSNKASVREAMETIDRGTIEIALVVADDRRLVGTVTDGDIRRAILKGGNLDDPVECVMNRQFTAVREDTSRTEVLDLMRARTLAQIPIVDSCGGLLGVHLMREIVGGPSRPNWAVVMAGGRGERLRPLTDSLPKPMVRVAGRPILERIVLHLVGHGISRVFLSVNYRADLIKNHFCDGSNFGCKVGYLEEFEPLGSGGALSLLPETPEEPIVVLNGDLVTQADIGAMLKFHMAGSYAVTVGCHGYVHTVPYGVLDVEGSRVTGMREKPSQTWTTNAGIYVLEPVLLARVPPASYFPFPRLVEECLDRGEPVGAFQIEEDWFDIGRPRELLRARGLDGDQ